MVRGVKETESDKEYIYACVTFFFFSLNFLNSTLTSFIMCHMNNNDGSSVICNKISHSFQNDKIIFNCTLYWGCQNFFFFEKTFKGLNFN